jgi:hypothetical protein
MSQIRITAPPPSRFTDEPDYTVIFPGKKEENKDFNGIISFYGSHLRFPFRTRTRRKEERE